MRRVVQQRAKYYFSGRYSLSIILWLIPEHRIEFQYKFIILVEDGWQPCGKVAPKPGQGARLKNTIPPRLKWNYLWQVDDLSRTVVQEQGDEAARNWSSSTRVEGKDQMTKEARIRSNECSKALHVSELNQGFTAGRQYRESWLDSRGAAPMGNKILFLYNYGCLRMYVQGCLKMYVHETITWANEQSRPTRPRICSNMTWINGIWPTIWNYVGMKKPRWSKLEHVKKLACSVRLRLRLLYT